jgi:tetratricopeptide (TPR) repeat protein
MTERTGQGGAPKPKMQPMTRHTVQAAQAAGQAQRRPPAPEARQAAPPEEAAGEDVMSQEEYEAWAAEHPDDADRLEKVTLGLAKGLITPAEAYGISVQDMAEAAVLGSEAFEAGNLESAVIIFEGLVTADPNVPMFRVSLAQCYEKMGYNEEAIDNYGVALDLYEAIEGTKLEDLADALVLRSALLVNTGREAEALEDLEYFLPEEPADLGNATPSIQQGYAMLMSLLEKASKAEEAAAAAAAPAPENKPNA